MKRRLNKLNPTRAFFISLALSLGVLLVISCICASFSGFFENSREGVGYLSLVTVLLSGIISGFIAMKLQGAILPALLSTATLCLLLSVTAMLLGGFSLAAFMNHITIFLLSVPGMLIAARNGKRGRRR